MVVRIADLVSSYSTYQDGEVVYRAIAPLMRAGGDVTVSFAGVDAVPSSFVNAALIRLLEDVPFEVIRSKLHIVDSTRQINSLIRDRFAFAVRDSHPS